MTLHINRYTRVACIALVLAYGPCFNSVTDAVAQDDAAQPVAVQLTPDGVTDELALRDGTRAYGRVERIDGGIITFRTTAGADMQVPTLEVVSLHSVDGDVVGGTFRREDPNPTRLFFGPTGRSLKQGTAYLGVYEIVLPFVQVGLTDRISVGAGTPLIFGDAGNRPFWITPKVQVYSGKSTQLSAGVMHFLNVGDGNIGIAYVVATKGSADSAVTGGIGYAYDRSYDDRNGAPVAMIGGEHRTSRGLKLMTENYIFSGGAILTGGVRWIGEHFSTDLAMVVPTDGGSTVAFPLVNVVYTWSK
ncbi:MAG: hypothetical protein ABL982_06485 [Vicinamibacterales bacterium]